MRSSWRTLVAERSLPLDLLLLDRALPRARNLMICGGVAVVRIRRLPDLADFDIVVLALERGFTVQERNCGTNNLFQQK